MDTSSGSPTLVGLLMSTLSCGSFSSSTGYFHLLLVHSVLQDRIGGVPCLKYVVHGMNKEDAMIQLSHQLIQHHIHTQELRKNVASGCNSSIK